MAKAAIIYGKEDIRVEERTVPEVEESDVLIKVSACAICGSDLHAYHLGNLYAPGTVIGHEFSGAIIDTGKEVQNLKKGQRVCVEPYKDLIGIFVDGGLAEYCLVKNAKAGGNVHLLPDAVSDEAGALIESFSVGLHGVRRADPKPGDRVVILGSGPIGLSTLIGLRTAGINDIIVTDISEIRLKMAQELGATAVFNASQGTLADFLKKYAEETQTAPEANIVMDCAGVPKVLTEGLNCLTQEGKAVILAVYTERVEFDLVLLQLKEIEIIGAIAYKDEFTQAIELAASGKSGIEKLISHRYPLANFNEAIKMQADSKSSIKVMVHP